MKEKLKQVILSLINSEEYDSEDARKAFKDYIQLKTKLISGITEAEAESEDESEEEDLSELRFGLEDDGNVEAVKTELKRNNVQFEIQQDGNITYFQFVSKDEHDKGIGLAEKVIDKSKEQ